MRTRQSNRKLISLPGRYSTGLGEPHDVILHDLSCGGCRFSLGTKKVGLGSALQIYVGGTGPHRATVRWIKGGEVGLGFTKPLSPQQFEGFQASHIPDPANANKSDAFADLGDLTPQRFC